MLRDRLNPNRPCVDQRRQAPGIAVVDATAQRRYFVHCFELRQQHCGQQIGGDIGRTNIHPRIFIDFAAKKLAAISSLFANDLGAARQFRTVRQEGTSLPATKFFDLVKAVAAHIADGAQKAPLVSGVDALRRILDHDRGRAFDGERHDRVHLAADARVVHWHDRAGTRSDRGLDLCLVDVKGIAPNVDEFHLRSRNQNAFAVETKV